MTDSYDWIRAAAEEIVSAQFPPAYEESREVAVWDAASVISKHLPSRHCETCRWWTRKDKKWGDCSRFGRGELVGTGDYECLLTEGRFGCIEHELRTEPKP